MTDDLATEHHDATAIATAAGSLLLALRDDGNAELGARGDAGAHRFIVDELARRYPDDLIRSEEGLESVAGDGRLWIVDPLDGTREFAEVPRPDWAVHVAMAIGGQPVVGAVALPALGLTLNTGQPPALAPAAAVPRMVVSRSRPPVLATSVAELLGAELVAMGSAGFKIAAVIRGEAEIYVHAGGQYEWDSAAPVAVAQAAGLFTSRIDGTPLRYGQPDPWLPDLVVCRAELADAVLAAIAQVGP